MNSGFAATAGPPSYDSAVGRSSLVSIVVPAHNAAPWLRDTLDCALAQSWPHKEVIVVDDGSTDATLAAAREYEDRGVRVLSQPNRGPSAARNAGVQASRGAYVQYLDADDLMSPDKLELQVQRLAQEPAGALAICRWARFRTDPSRARGGASPYWRDMKPADYLAQVARTGSSVPLHAWLIPRAIAERIGPWAEDLSLMEDHEYFARAALASSGICFCPQPLCLYRSFHSRTLSKQRSPHALHSMFQAVERVAALLQKAAPERHRQIAADYYQWLVYALYPEQPELTALAQERVRALGGSQVRPRMGRRAMALSRIVGWKAVQRLRSWLWSRNIYVGSDDVISD
jgi:glycosyltransferase involved in cell wall biosynthesis